MGMLYLYELIFPNGKSYWGISKHPKVRFKQHIGNAKKSSSPLYAAFRKYGIENVKFELVCASSDFSLVLELEHQATVLYSLHPDGYNLKLGGRANTHFSESSRKKISEANRGKFPSEETREKLRKAQRARGPRSEETKQKMRESFAKRDPEQYRKTAEAMKGRAVSEETRAKQAEAKLGKKRSYSEETKAKIRATWLAKRIARQSEKEHQSA